MNNNPTSRETRDANGRWKPGISGNPEGKNGWSTIKPLLDALDEMGEKRGEHFWQMVARKAFSSDRILSEVMKKLLPDKLKGEGLSAQNIINLIRPEQNGKNNTTPTPTG